MSNALRGYWFLIFPAIGLVVLRASAGSSDTGGRQRWDRFKLQVPMKIGDVVQKIALARFSRTLATLVAAGVDIITALEITAGTAGNWVIETALHATSERVHDGVPISVPLADDASSRRWSARWSRSARRPESSTRCSARSPTSTRTRSTRASQSLTSIIEPMLMIGVGAMVGTIVISMYLPMFKLLTLIK